VHPASTVLFLIGYFLAIPIAFRMPRVVEQQHRLALTGHQVGVTLAMLGWLSRGAVTMAVIHVVWMIGVRVWFSANAGGRSS
jgi:hypothetical protein